MAQAFYKTHTDDIYIRQGEFLCMDNEDLAGVGILDSQGVSYDPGQLNIDLAVREEVHSLFTSDSHDGYLPWARTGVRLGCWYACSSLVRTAPLSFTALAFTDIISLDSYG